MRREIEEFNVEYGTEPGCMPQRRALETAGRYDLARSMEKWGGQAEVASLVGLAVSRKSRGGRKRRGKEADPWASHVASVGDRTGLQGKALFREAAAGYTPPVEPSPPQPAKRKAVGLAAPSRGAAPR
jgi:hypothetical protein